MKVKTDIQDASWINSTDQQVDILAVVKHHLPEQSSKYAYSTIHTVLCRETFASVS